MYQLDHALGLAQLPFDYRSHTTDHRLVTSLGMTLIESGPLYKTTKTIHNVFELRKYILNLHDSLQGATNVCRCPDKGAVLLGWFQGEVKGPLPGSVLNSLSIMGQYQLRTALVDPRHDLDPYVGYMRNVDYCDVVAAYHGTKGHRDNEGKPLKPILSVVRELQRSMKFGTMVAPTRLMWARSLVESIERTPNTPNHNKRLPYDSEIHPTITDALNKGTEATLHQKGNEEEEWARKHFFVFHDPEHIRLSELVGDLGQ